jgi:hypothetical protein
VDWYLERSTSESGRDEAGHADENADRCGKECASVARGWKAYGDEFRDDGVECFGNGHAVTGRRKPSSR